MTSIRIVLASLCLISYGNIYAQQTQKLNIDQATVFLSGAELVSTAQINLQKGDNEVVFTNVAGDVNTESIAVSATNETAVTSVTFQNNYLAPEALSPRAKTIKDSIETVKEEQEALNNKIMVLKEEVAILFNNQKISGDNTGLSVAEVTKMLDLVNARMEGYLTQQKKEEHLLSKTNEILDHLNKQLAAEQKKEQPGGQLIVKLYAKEATTSNISVDYVVPNAGWSPTYDIMADNTSSPVKLFYKANIHQNSGIKWNNVRLTLSSGNPTQGMQAPLLEPSYLSFYSPSDLTYQWSNKNKQIATNQITDLVALAPGVYETQKGKNGYIGGARSDGTTYTIDGVTVQGAATINNYVAVDNAGINTSFDIDIPYTIPSDGQEHLVAIKKYELPATYRYYAVPKIDKDAFLQAQITNWEELNLLPGKTNIFYEGTYVGEGAIDVRNTRDTMTISLGRDKKIVVKRTQDVKQHSVKTIGSNERETFAYTITVRNTRKENITIVVQDQIPVSNDKDIVLEDKETGDAQYDETSGLLKWTVSLSGNETKSLPFGYTVKYPKGKTVNNLR